MFTKKYHYHTSDQSKGQWKVKWPRDVHLTEESQCCENLTKVNWPRDFHLTEESHKSVSNCTSLVVSENLSCHLWSPIRIFKPLSSSGTKDRKWTKYQGHILILSHMHKSVSAKENISSSLSWQWKVNIISRLPICYKKGNRASVWSFVVSCPQMGFSGRQWTVKYFRLPLIC